MYLKRLELEGFKSFADRTVIPFEDGLTGIVGPNGCGKSNVVDALLWVLAERSPKTLRADSMEDVIFEGSEGRPAAPYAMAEIILVDEEHELEGGGEVAVGRRLFRTGESEFLLNGRRVRRKDVREVLLRAGLGVRGYMVLAQGKIDAVLAANPKDRRSVLEEAAGISRYKARKHETLLKLASVGQNLERVDDVLSEVQRVVRSLKIQAGKAQRYLEFRDRYREVRVKVALADESAHRKQERALRERESEVEERLQTLRCEREQAEDRLGVLERESETLRERWEGLRSEASSTKEEAAGLEERARGLEARAAELDQRVSRERERLEELDRSVRERAAVLAGLGEEQHGLAEQKARSDQALAREEAEFAGRQEAHRRLNTEIEELRKGVLEALAERTRLHNLLGEIASRRSEGEGALRALERRKGETAAELERLSAERIGAGKELRAAQERVDAAEGENAEWVAERERQREAVESHSRKAREADNRAAEARARLEALSAVEESGQGLPEAVRALLERQPEGVSGLLLEGIRVPAPWDRLVENLLGRMQHALWAADRAHAAGEDELDFFFPPERAGGSVHVPAAQPLRSLIEGDADRCDALCARLGEVYCTETAEEAARLAAEHPGALFLAKDGELHGPGFVRVGMLQSDAAGLLARRNAREAARAVVAAAEEERAAALAAEGAARELLDAAEEKLEALASDLRGALSARDRAQGRHDEAERRAAALGEEVAALEAEEAPLRASLQQAVSEETEAGVARDRAETQRAESAKRLEGAETRRQEVEAVFEEARTRLQEARIAHEKVQQQSLHLEQRSAETSALAEQGQAERARLDSEVGEILRRADQLREEAEQTRVRIRELLGRRAELEERVAEAAEQWRRASEALTQERGRRESEGGQLERILEQRQELALELQRVRMQQEEMSRGVQEEFQQPLDALSRSLGIEPAEFRLEAEEHAVLAEELAGLKQKLDGIGSVNLEAVRDLEEREERAAFLERERDDLVGARTTLEATLEELDVQCRERFTATFELVRDEFQAIFRRLFRGGRAEVCLTPEMDPLEAGIEISVRPPGKELRSINLLSGGERTLTALALLLAVFRSRPSPFCLLDEVDAALDDANVERFLSVLTDFTKDTQFIVVTHNRLTMGRCARLFGVTMRKPGISMLVAVELADVITQGLSEATARKPAATGEDRGVKAVAQDRLGGEREAFAEG